MGAENNKTPGKQPICRKCIHFYITHDPGKPYGCRAMGFKSKKNPALVVFESSGLQCQLFEMKSKPPTGRKGGFGRA